MLRDDIEVAKARTKMVQEMPMETALDLWAAKFGLSTVHLNTKTYENDVLWFHIGRKLMYAGLAKRSIHGTWHTYYLRKEAHGHASST